MGKACFLAATPSCPPCLGESLEERFPQTPFRPFYAAKTSVLAGFFWDGSPLPRLGAAPCKWASSGPSPVVERKPNNPLGAPEAGMTSPGGSRFPYRWFAPGLAEGVSRGGNYLPRTCAPLRGWLQVLTRLGESLEERFPQTPFRPFCAAKTSVLAEFFWDASLCRGWGRLPANGQALAPRRLLGESPTIHSGPRGRE